MATRKPRTRPLFSFPLDENLKAQLDAVRKNTGVPVAWQIRRGIELFLATQTDAVKSVPKPPKGRKK